MLTLHVKHGKTAHQVQVKRDARMLAVMQTIEHLTEVPIRQQKLICQGKVVDSNSTVEGSNLKQGSKVMLMTAGGQTQVIPPTDNSEYMCKTAKQRGESIALRCTYACAGPECCATSHQRKSCGS